MGIPDAVRLDEWLGFEGRCSMAQGLEELLTEFEAQLANLEAQLERHSDVGPYFMGWAG